MLCFVLETSSLCGHFSHCVYNICVVYVNSVVYTPVSLLSARIFNQVFIIPIKENDRNDVIETKHVWMINVPLVMMDSKLILPVVIKKEN